MPLSSAWVDRIHARLMVRYGSAWFRMWEGVEPETVKADWANALDRMPAEAITYALDHLPPDYPPSVGQFRALCNQRPLEPYRALPAPTPDKEKVAAEVAKLQTLKQEIGSTDWAKSLEQREKAGDKLTEAQRLAWRRAIRASPGESERILAGEFKPIDPNCLPPAMRREMGIA